MDVLPNEIRIPFTSHKPLDQALAHAGNAVALEGVSHFSHESVARYLSQIPGAAGWIELARRTDVKELGCAIFTGPDRLSLLLGATTAMSLVPIDILHSTARASPIASARLEALQVIARTCPFYATPRAQRAVAATVVAALRDPDPLVRSYAPITAIATQLPSAVAAVHEMRARENDPLVRQVLDDISHHLGDAPNLEEPFLPEREPRMALPFFPIRDLGETLKLFLPDLAQGELRGAGEVFSVEVSDTPARDASVHLMDDTRWSVGCAYFRGADAVSFARTLSGPFHYFPIEVAALAAQHGPDEMDRARALFAIGLANLRRPSVEKVVNPELDALLIWAGKDLSELVRGMAVTVSALRMEERA